MTINKHMEKEIKEMHLRQDSFEQRLFRIEEMYKNLEKQNKDILDLLRPISSTYNAATTLRKWINALAIAIVTFVGAFFALRQIYNYLLHKPQ